MALTISAFQPRKALSADTKTVTVTVEPGRHWKHTLMKIMKLYPVRTTPQIAIWIEDSDGGMLETLYVTRRYAEQDWRKTPGEDVPEGGIVRKSALPLWAYRYAERTGKHVGGSAELPDAVSAASPKGAFSIEREITGLPEQFTVCVELNNSADFNEGYPRDSLPGTADYSGGKYGSGQPSILYSGRIDSMSSDSDIHLCAEGHGSPDGSQGDLIEELSTLTTAKEIVRAVTVSIR